MMYEEDIQKVNEWFDAHTEYYGTSRSENEYSIESYDLDDFTKFLSDEFPDLCYIRCHLGTGDSTIWMIRNIPIMKKMVSEFKPHIIEFS